MVDISFTIVMQWINFAILLLLLHKILFKPLMAFLEKRSQEISSSIKDARLNKEKSEEVLQSYEQKIREIKQEADGIFEETRKKALSEKHGIVEAARKESKDIVEQTSLEIGQEVVRAKQQLMQEIAGLVTGCASKVLEREVKAADHTRIIDEFMKKEV